MKAFKTAGLEPKIILSAIDADVCKTYIEFGLGIGILHHHHFDPRPATSACGPVRPNIYSKPAPFSSIFEPTPICAGTCSTSSSPWRRG